MPHPQTDDTDLALPAARGMRQDAVRRLIDQAEVGELLDRYVNAFDELLQQPRDDDWFRGVFTDDLVLAYPIGGHRGIAGLADFQRAAKRKWAVTHHVTSNHRVTVDADRATIQAQLLATHVRRGDAQDRFTMGGRVHGTAVRTSCGWRLSELVFVLLWSAGEASAGSP